MRHTTVLATLLSASVLLGPAETAPAHEHKLVVYSGRGEALVSEIFERYQKATGVELDVRYNDTPALTTQILAEGAESPADVIYLQESGSLGVLAEHGRLDALPDRLLVQTDKRFNDPNGRWIGISGRARVLVYNTEVVKKEDLPKTLFELADPKWKGKLGWAPSNASFHAHVSFLRHAWGNDKTRRWLTEMKALEPKVYPKNSPQVEAANSGEISIGWVNHYYLHKLTKPGYKAANYSFPTDGDPGNVLMVSGAAVRRGTAARRAAYGLLAYLVSPAIQRYIAEQGFEYPTRPGVAVLPSVTPLSELHLAQVDQAHLTDLTPTLAMLRELGLQ